MAIPKNHERHFIACALCGEIHIALDLKNKWSWINRHSRFAHNKTSSYLEDATRTVTVIYENNSDPTTQFLTLISWMNEEDHL